MKRRKKILERYAYSQEKIRKHKQELDKQFEENQLLAAMKREDTLENLRRNQNLKEFIKLNKLKKIENRKLKLENIQNEKEKIKNTKRFFGENLAMRRKLLKDKVTNILTSGKFNSKEEIYKKIFNNDELQTLGQAITEGNEDKKISQTMNQIKNDDKDKVLVTEGNDGSNEK